MKCCFVLFLLTDLYFFNNSIFIEFILNYTIYNEKKINKTITKLKKKIIFFSQNNGFLIKKNKILLFKI